MQKSGTWQFEAGSRDLLLTFVTLYVSQEQRVCSVCVLRAVCVLRLMQTLPNHFGFL